MGEIGVYKRIRKIYNFNVALSNGILFLKKA